MEKAILRYLIILTSLQFLGGAAPPSELWTFDNLASIGGHRVKAEGHPRVIDTPMGKAVEFSGKDDALFLDVHPLAGAETFTWEVIFRPDADGSPEQRFFHLQESGTDNRLLFEIRLTDGRWCLDSFAKSGAASRALMDRKLLHPAGAWYHVAMVYDGREFRNYVNGVQQVAAQLHIPPEGPGQSSVGVRINRVDYFKGAIRVSRMTPGALTPAEFMKLR